jgi:hypothetical protein
LHIADENIAKQQEPSTKNQQSPQATSNNNNKQPRQHFTASRKATTRRLPKVPARRSPSIMIFLCAAQSAVATALMAMTLTMPPSTTMTTMITTNMPHPAVALTPYQTACRPVWNELASPCYHQTIIQSTTSFFDEDDMLPEDIRIVVEEDPLPEEEPEPEPEPEPIIMEGK